MTNDSTEHDPSPVARVAAEREQERDALISAYWKAQDNWSAQCFCFTSAPEQLRRDAHQVARDGFNELVTLLGPIVRPWLQAEYRAAEEAAKTDRLHADAARPRSPQPEEKAAREQLLRSAPWEDDDLPMAERLMRAAEYVVQFDGCWFGHTDCIFLTELLREAAEAASPRAERGEVKPCTCPVERWSARHGDHAPECPSFSSAGAALGQPREEEK